MTGKGLTGRYIFLHDIIRMRIHRKIEDVLFIVTDHLKSTFPGKGRGGFLKSKQKYTGRGEVMNESFTHQEMIDCTPEQVVTMITKVCTELKLRIHRNLKQSNF